MPEVFHDICEYRGLTIQGSNYIGRTARVVADELHGIGSGDYPLDSYRRFKFTVVHYRKSGGEPLAVKALKKMIDERLEASPGVKDVPTFTELLTAYQRFLLTHGRHPKILALPEDAHKDFFVSMNIVMRSFANAEEYEWAVRAIERRYDPKAPMRFMAATVIVVEAGDVGVWSFSDEFSILKLEATKAV